MVNMVRNWLAEHQHVNIVPESMLAADADDPLTVPQTFHRPVKCIFHDVHKSQNDSVFQGKNVKKKKKKSLSLFSVVGCSIFRIRSTIQLHRHTPPHSNLSFSLSIFFLFHLSLSSCINASFPTWKPFALIYEGVCTVHIINLSPLWHSFAGIHPPFFILSVLL